MCPRREKQRVKMEEIEASMFSEYNLSPPPKTKKDGCTFQKAVKKINREFKDVWETVPDKETRKEEKKNIFGKKRILHFLYSRGFDHIASQQRRKERIGKLLSWGKDGEIREGMLHILMAEGDVNKSLEKCKHYIATCLVIIRYFQQDGATGFVDDMASLTYYLRNQAHGSCFLQAACVFASYLLQSYGKIIPPVDGSKLIRHNFMPWSY